MTPRQRNAWKRRLDRANRLMVRGMRVAMRAELRRCGAEAGRGELKIETHRVRVESILARWWLATAQGMRILVDDMLPDAAARSALRTRDDKDVEKVLAAIAALSVGNSEVPAVVAVLKAQPGVLAVVEKALVASAGNIAEAAAIAANAPTVQPALLAAIEKVAPLAPKPVAPALPAPPPGPPRLPPPPSGGAPPPATPPTGGGPSPESWDDLIARQVREQARLRSRKIAQGTQSQVTDALAKAAKDGLGEEATRKRLEETLQGSVSNARARTIARTEIGAAQNKAALVAADAKGQPYRREWLSIDDGRTRPSHLAADGQVTQPGEKFRVGLAMLDHPGDPSGPPGEIINCRCAILILPS